MSLLVETGLDKVLTERFEKLGSLFSLPGVPDENWDGTDFSPLLDRLARAVQRGEWSNTEVHIFLAALFEPGLAVQNTRESDAIHEAFKIDPFFQWLAGAGMGPDDFIRGVPAEALQIPAEAGIEMLREMRPENRLPMATAAMGEGLTMAEGDTVSFSLGTLFEERDGDMFIVLLKHKDRALTVLDDGYSGPFVLRAPNGVEGQFELIFIAQEGKISTDPETFLVTVTDAGPGALVMSRNQKVTLSAHDSLEKALAAGADGLAYRLVRQTGIDNPSDVVVAGQNTILDGAAGMTAVFTLSVGVASVTLRGAADFDVMGNDQRNLMIGNNGNNRLEGAAGADRLNGQAGYDWLEGGAGRDQLFGGNDYDVLVGGEDGDRLFGGGGDDFLNGGTGADMVWGGAGADVFLFRYGDQRLQVMDFNSAEDIIDLNAYRIVDFADLLAVASFREVRGDLRIQLHSDHFVIKEMTRAALTEDMFAFT